MAPSLEGVPPEVKNEIFSYILLGSDAPGAGHRHRKVVKRQFDISLLLVNKGLGAEAAAFLYRRNNFVLIKHEFFSFNQLVD